MLDIYQRPFFIRVLVPTGDPDGLRIFEKSNWPGVGVGLQSHELSCLQIALDGRRCRPGPDGKWANRMEGQGREDPQTKSSRGNGGKGS
jgi:hypothetical protein